MKPFRYNYHIAKPWSLKKVNSMIENYPKQYSVAKYLLFMKTMLERGWVVKIYKAGVSKYVFVEKGNTLYKVRFSNHKPLYGREVADDCDFYIGVSHTQISTTEQILSKLESVK